MSAVHATSVDDVTIDLGVLLRALWRARLWIIPLVLLTAVGSFIGLSMIPPTYKSEARLVVDPRDLPIGGSDRTSEVERAALDEQGVGSQVQLISSRDIARRIVENQKLVDDPEFRSFLGDLLAGIGLGGAPGSAEERALDAFADRLQVFQVEKSRVIQVEYSSRDAQKAARIVTGVIDEYRKASVEAKNRVSIDTTKWLSGEIEGLRRKVGDAEAKVEQYRAGADLFMGQNNVKISEQQLSELNSQLTAAKGQRTETEARVRQLKRLLEGGGGNLEIAAEVTASPLIQRLRERQIALRARAAELSTTYLSNHPQVQAVTAQQGDVERQIKTEAAKILAGYENELKVGDGRIRHLEAQLNEFKSQSAKAGEEDVQLRALEREAKVQRDQLEEFLARYRDGLARQAAGSQSADARVISAPSAPVKPSFPKVIPLTSVITLVVFLLACTWVVLREFLSGNVLRQTTLTAYPPPLPAQTIVPFVPAARRAEAEIDEPSAQAHADRPASDAAAPSRDEAGAPRGLIDRVLSRRAGRVEAEAATVDRGEIAARVDADAPTAAPLLDDHSQAHPETVRSTDRAAASDEIETHDVRDVAPDVARVLPSRAEAPVEPRAEAMVERIWREIASQAHDGQRIVVTSATTDRAAHVAALAILRVAARRGARICLVDLMGVEHDLADMLGLTGSPGLSDLLDGHTSFSRAIFRDRASRGHVVLSGSHPLTPETLAGDDLDAALDALDLTYDHLVLDVGLLASGDGVADIVASADAVVVAADGRGDDPRTRRTLEVLRGNAPAVWVLSVDDGEVRRIADVA